MIRVRRRSRRLWSGGGRRSGGRSCRRSTRPRWPGSPGLRPAWPLWLNTHDPDAATVAEALALGCRGLAVDWRALDRRSVERATAAGLEVVAYTVRRRATFDRLARLGVVAVCVEAAALDG